MREEIRLAAWRSARAAGLAAARRRINAYLDWAREESKRPHQAEKWASAERRKLLGK